MRVTGFIIVGEFLPLGSYNFSGFPPNTSENIYFNIMSSDSSHLPQVTDLPLPTFRRQIRYVNPQQIENRRALRVPGAPPKLKTSPVTDTNQ